VLINAGLNRCFIVGCLVKCQSDNVQCQNFYIYSIVCDQTDPKNTEMTKSIIGDKIQVVVIDDDKVVVKNLQTLLESRGHNFLGSSPNAKDGLKLIKETTPDLIICDISLEGDTDGIDLIKKIRPFERPPVIFLTAHKDEKYYQKARETNPYLYMTKPVDPDLLDRNIELAFQNWEPKGQKEEVWEKDIVIKDAFFTKIGNKLKKIYTRDVKYIEVEGKYCAIHIEDRKINVKISLKDFLHKLPPYEFQRISRNYIVNINKIENIDTFRFEVKVDGQHLPVSRTYKEALYRRLNLI